MDVLINQRFSSAIDECVNLGLAKNKADFAAKIGVSASRISEMIGKRMGISSEICKSLYEVFNINLEWLLIGKGEMLRQVSAGKPPTPPVAAPAAMPEHTPTIAEAAFYKEFLEKKISK